MRGATSTGCRVLPRDAELLFVRVACRVVHLGNAAFDSTHKCSPAVYRYRRPSPALPRALANLTGAKPGDPAPDRDRGAYPISVVLHPLYGRRCACSASGAGLVLISLFLTWYNVTLTALGVHFYESLDKVFLRLACSRRLPTPSVDSQVRSRSRCLRLVQVLEAWRWAILVVSIVLLLEVLLAYEPATTKSQSAPAWPHGAVLLLLSVGDLILVVVALLSLPYGGTPSTYVAVAAWSWRLHRALGRLLVACAGAGVGLEAARPAFRVGPRCCWSHQRW